MKNSEEKRHDITAMQKEIHVQSLADSGCGTLFVFFSFDSVRFVVSPK